MKQYECKKVENCFGGTNVYEYRLPIRADDQFLDRIAAISSLKYFKNFPRPFFQALFPNNTTVKGVISDYVIKVYFQGTDPQEDKETFEVLLNKLLNRGTVGEENF
ncbi:MAG: hypothetical protein LBR56_05405, partial [Sporomusaceae bacterium]|nr:hypothetical protein [Sporomusaceae bacterium]